MDSVPDYAAVTTTVQLAKTIHNNLGGLTNAILRTLIKHEERNVPDEHTPISTMADYLSHPEWLISKWIKDQNFKKAKALAEWNNEYPNLWFRVNRLLFTPAKFKNYLKMHDIEFKSFEYISEFFQINQHQK